jgi:hypothetical protein
VHNPTDNPAPLPHAVDPTIIAFETKAAKEARRNAALLEWGGSPPEGDGGSGAVDNDEDEDEDEDEVKDEDADDGAPAVDVEALDATAAGTNAGRIEEEGEASHRGVASQCYRSNGSASQRFERSQ